MSKKNSSVNLKNGFKNFEDLSKIFLNFKNQLNLINKKNFAVAVSGGPDSLALVALTRAYTYYKKSKFSYILVDHGIRKNSKLEAKKVKILLKKKQLDLEIISNTKKIEKNIQGVARNIRYKLLSNYCLKNDIKILITAHNLEDQVETFFIRLSRGSGLKGLSSMSFKSKLCKKINLYRPLLDVKKQSLIKISKLIFGNYIKDPSNSNSKYLRTKVRNLKKPLENSGVKYDQIFKSIKNLSESKASLDEFLKKIFDEIIKKKNKEIFINFNKFDSQSNLIKMAIINEAIKKLKKNYYDLRAKKVNNLINKVSKKDFKKSTLGGCIFYKKGHNLCLKNENP
jgi:tRNA(Ile)-lysidine synthase